MSALINFIVNLIGKIFPMILKESKKPKEVEVLGDDKEIKDDMHATLEDQIKNASDPAEDTTVVDEIGVPRP